MPFSNKKVENFPARKPSTISFQKWKWNYT